MMDLKNVKKLLANAKRVAVGVSGGIDSMVLIDWIAKNKKAFSCNFLVIHVDHGINENSSQWMNFVKNKAQDLGFEFLGVKVSLAHLSNNLEYAARQARYKVFCESQCDNLILAHHANDQCETFLLKLFRGSGIKGLKSMSEASACWYDNRVSVIRPMLSITRQQIEEYARDNMIEHINDPSNQDSKYDRNYVRNEIWPVIEKRFDIADVNTIRSIQHLAEAWELTTNLADIDYSSIRIDENTLDWYKMKNLGYIRAKNVVLRILDKENIYGFTIGHIEQFTRGLMNATLDNKTELYLSGFIMYKIGKRIKFMHEEKKVA